MRLSASHQLTIPRCKIYLIFRNEGALSYHLQPPTCHTIPRGSPYLISPFSVRAPGLSNGGRRAFWAPMSRAKFSTTLTRSLPSCVYHLLVSSCIIVFRCLVSTILVSTSLFSPWLRHSHHPSTSPLAENLHSALLFVFHDRPPLSRSDQRTPHACPLTEGRKSRV